MASLSTRRNAAQQIVLPTTADGGEALSKNFAWIDAVQGGVKDRTDTPPGSPSEGDLYILTGTPTGAWSAQAANDLAMYYNSGWLFFTPPSAEAGLRLYVIDEAQDYRWDGSAWNIVPAGDMSDLIDDTTPQLGGNLDVNGFNVGGVTPTEFTYLSGVTSDIQTQLDGKAATSHTHTASDITDFDTEVSNNPTVASALQDVVDDTTPQLGGNLDVNGNSIVSVSNGNISLIPDGTGNVVLGTLTFDGDMAVTSNEDDYVLTYDDSTGTVSLEVLPTTSKIDVKNDTAGTLLKGRAVHVSGSHTSGKPTIEYADSSSASTMNAIGILEDDIVAGGEGNVILAGIIENIDTSSYTSGDTLYVGTSGVLTDTKPTGTDLIQNMGMVGRSHASAGSFIVIGSGRSNDIPNLPQDFLWVGNASGVATPTNRNEITELSDDTTPQLGGNLDMNGFAFSSPAAIDNDAAGPEVSLLFQNGGTSTAEIQYDDGAQDMYFAAGGTVAGGATKMTIESGGNVGIGTTSPDSLLHVYSGDSLGSHHSEAILGVENSTHAAIGILTQNTQHARIYFGDQDDPRSGRIEYDHANDLLEFWTNQNQQMVINSSGNVGIGTASPTAQTHIVNDVTTDVVLRVQGVALQTAKLQEWQDSTSTVVGSMDDNGNFAAQSTVTTNYNVALVGMQTPDLYSSTGNLTITAGNNASATGELIFETNNAGTATERVRIDETGNVGIGSIAPGAKLEVQQSADDSGIKVFGSTASTQFLELDLDVTGYSNINASLGFRFQKNGSNVAFIDDSATNGFRIYDDIPLTFGATSSTRYGMERDSVSGNLRIAYSGMGTDLVNIDSTGNVGIGTASPAHAIHVVNSAWSFVGTSTETDATDKAMRLGSKHYTNAEEPCTAIYAYNNSSNNHVLFGGGTGMGNAATLLSFYTAANNTTTLGTERMRIDSSGNVGIGTASPSSNLHVEGTTASANVGVLRVVNNTTTAGQDAMRIMMPSAASGALNFSNNGGKFWRWFLGTAGEMRFDSADGVSKMYLTETGNLGLGAAPGAKLHTSGGDMLLVCSFAPGAATHKRWRHAT